MQIAGRDVAVWNAGDAGRALVVLVGCSEADLPAIGRAAQAQGRAALVSVACADWDAELSPWPARRAFRGGADFAGGAPALQAAVVAEILPRLSGTLGVSSRRFAAGYSLAGLFALDLFARHGSLDGAASASGSLWFDGWTDWLRAAPLDATGKRVYLSLGDREAKTRNARLAAVEERTREAEALFRARGAETLFESNPGNHFQDAGERLAKGVRWLLRD